MFDKDCFSILSRHYGFSSPLQTLELIERQLEDLARGESLTVHERTALGHYLTATIPRLKAELSARKPAKH